MKKLILPIILILGITMILGIVSVNALCEDSDGGKNYYTTGEATGIKYDQPSITNYTQKDVCNSGSQEGTLSEAFCDKNGNVFYDTIQCPNGCKDGACIKGEPFTCLDSDSKNSDGRADSNLGKNYFEEGTATGYEGSNLVTSIDACSGTTLVEVYCEGRDLKIEQHPCPNGCENAVCLPCQGCEVGDSCYQIGDRDQNSFCSAKKEFISQKQTGESCTSSYECSSNSCSNGKCQGFFGKYLIFIIGGIIFVILLIILIFFLIRKKSSIMVGQ